MTERETSEDRKKTIRNGVRTRLDRLEAAAREGKPLTLTSTECAEFALLLRQIQEEAESALGYA